MAENTKGRIEQAHILYYVVLLIVIIVIVRILLIQFRDGDELRAKAESRAVVVSTIKADRGNIYSQDGELIATSLPRFDIYVDFSQKNVEEEHFQAGYDSLALCLAQHFPSKSYQEYKRLLKQYRDEQQTYGLVLRNIDYMQLQQVRKFPLFRLGRYKGGIIEEKKEKRVHPYGILAQRTIGFSRQNFKVGLEGAYDSQLAGKDGKRLKQRLPNNKYVPLDDNYLVAPIQGIDLITTLDMHVQDVAESALFEHLQKHDAQWGCAVLMEVQTGEIRAIANLEKDNDGNYRETYNHAIGTLYEPGSSFKLFSMLIMLDDGKLDLKRKIHTGNGKIRVGNKEISDAHPLGEITVREVFEQSSNVGTVMLVREFYKKNPAAFIDKLYKMKLHLPMGIDIRGEQPAKLLRPTDEKWSESSLASISYGYGISITPLQLLAYYNAVVNNGRLMRPLFVKEFRLSGKTIRTFSPVVLHHAICKPSTADTLKSLMLGVVERGTAKNLKNAACKIGGKTATARIWDNATQTYADKYNATFVGYFPADNPKYSCIVVVNRPSKGLYYGGNVAAPVFKDIAEIVFATEQGIHDMVINKNFVGFKALPCIQRIHKTELQGFVKLMPQELQSVKMPDCEWISMTNDSIPCFQEVKFSKNVMPDVVGMTLRDATYLLEGMGYKVHATGKGKVASQSVQKGTLIHKGHTVLLTLK